MITDKLINSALYETLHPLFAEAFKFIQTTELLNLAHGRHDLAGDNLFVIYMEYMTKDKNECRLENHRRYIDIQLILEGEEYIGISNFDNQHPEIPYNAEKDIAFYNDEYDSLIKLQKNEFAIFYPHDLHMPCLNVSSSSLVKKVVFKIAVQ